MGKGKRTMKKTKKTKKAKRLKQPSEEQQLLARVLCELNGGLRGNRVLQWLVGAFEENVYDLEKDIENELAYAKWEAGGAYASAAKEAKAHAKRLQKVKDDYQEMIKLLQKVEKTRSKTAEIW
jgi:hypothetical protein